jgi:hypothetical protein
MQNVIERIARHADIDTRHAMGFGPRKMPPSELTIPRGSIFRYRRYTGVEFPGKGVSMQAYATGTRWMFTKIGEQYTYQFEYDRITGKSYIPELKEDGTFSKW